MRWQTFRIGPTARGAKRHRQEHQFIGLMNQHTHHILADLLLQSSPQRADRAQGCSFGSGDTKMASRVDGASDCFVGYRVGMNPVGVYATYSVHCPPRGEAI
ncbi:hypothetical protein PENSPDRAFT_241504 [Peniophora sp. CONT]|nr:hypothetical protein PENSPDRAFT_241504 [Peniophora sp. CONT]